MKISPQNKENMLRKVFDYFKTKQKKSDKRTYNLGTDIFSHLWLGQDLMECKFTLVRYRGDIIKRPRILRIKGKQQQNLILSVLYTKTLTLNLFFTFYNWPNVKISGWFKY